MLIATTIFLLSIINFDLGCCSSSSAEEFLCYASTDCRGNVVQGRLNKGDCCAADGQNGLSFSRSRVCGNCFPEEEFISPGLEYYFAFPNNLKLAPLLSYANLRVKVSPSNVSAAVNISTMFGTVGDYQQSNEVMLDDDLKLTSISEREKGLHVISSGGRVSVFALSEEGTSSDIFFVLPPVYIPDLYEYYAVSVERNDSEAIHHSAILIVATEDHTEIEMTPKTRVNVTLAPDINGSGSPDEVMSIILDKLETLYVTSLESLSGTRVVSNKPITFISGHECGNIPKGLAFCDQMFEQIPPTTTWGKEFFTAPLKGRNRYDVFKVVSSRDNTTVRLQCSLPRNSTEIVLSSAGDIISVNIRSEQYCRFVSNKPVLLVQFAVAAAVDEVEADPFMMLIPPVEQYRNYYSIVTFEPRSRNLTYFVNIVLKSDDAADRDSLLLNGSPVAGVWTDIICDDNRPCGYGLQLEIDVVDYVLSSNSSVLFGATVYAFGLRVGLGYVAGLNQRPQLDMVSFSVDMYEANESDTALMVKITLQRAAPSDTPVSVVVKTRDLQSPNAAKSFVDYIPIDTVVVFEQNEVSKVLLITLAEDDVFPENNKTFEVFITATPGVYVSPFGYALATVLNDDEPLPVMNISFGVSSVLVMENRGFVELMLTKSEGAVGPITVNVATVNGTAVAGVDFRLLNTEVVFEAEDLTATAFITLTNDDQLHQKRDFSASIEVVPGRFPAQVIDPVVNITIEDDDMIVIGLTPVNQEIMEGGEVVIDVEVLFGSLQRDVLLNVTTVGENATEGVDYTSLSISLTFSSNMTSTSVVVPILSDNVLEQPEVFSISVSHNEGENVFTLPSQSDIWIIDQSEVEIGFDVITASVEEGSSLSVKVMVRKGVLEVPVQVVLYTLPNTAAGGKDFETIQETILVFDEKKVEQTVNITVYDNMLNEGVKDFSIRLNLMSSARVQLEPSMMTVEIIDDENPPRVACYLGSECIQDSFAGFFSTEVCCNQLLAKSVGFSVAGGSCQPCVSIGFSEAEYRLQESLVNYTIPITVTGGKLPTFAPLQANPDNTAESDDFIIFNPVVGLMKESTGDDLVLEVTLDEYGKQTDSPVESFSLQLLHNANILPPNFVLGSTVIRMIDVVPEVYINQEVYDVNEEDGMVLVFVSVDEERIGNINFSIIFSNNSAFIGLDYTITLTSFIITPDQNSIAINVDLINDNIVEGLEFIDLKVTSVQGAELGRDVTQIRITDIDNATIEFVNKQYSVREDEDHVTVCVGIREEQIVTLDFTVEFNTIGDSAVGGMDYTDVSTTLSFSGEIMKCVLVPINSDSLVEGNEQFFVEISLQNGLERIRLGNRRAVVQIIDVVTRDVRVGFGLTSYTVPETELTVLVSVVAEGIFDGPIILELYAMGLTADGDDFIFESPTRLQSVLSEFPIEVSIPIVNDCDREGNEIFKLSINTTILSGVTFVNNMATVVIIDNSLILTDDDLLQFIDLGSAAIYLPQEDDTVSMAINPRSGFRAFGRTYSDIYVTSNGVITLGESSVECCPVRFEDLPSTSAPFIAPYWIDNDPSTGGNVSYAVFESGSIINDVSRFISSVEDTIFLGTWMLVSYWENLPENLLSEQVSSYQAVLITDGARSYVVFIYNCRTLHSESVAGIGYYFSRSLQMEYVWSNTINSSLIGCENVPCTQWNNAVFTLFEGVAPDPPTNVSRGPVTSSSIQISWSPPVTDIDSSITGYVVTISGPIPTEPIDLSSDITSYVFENLTPNTTYIVGVQAKNEFGESAAIFITEVTARAVELSLQQSQYRVAEGTSNSLVCVEVSGGSIVQPMTVFFMNIFISASGDDFAMAESVVLTATNPIGCVRINVFIDNIIEADETFMIVISTNTEHVTLGTASATVTIIGELAMIGFERGMFAVVEPRMINVCVTVRNGLLAESLAVPIDVLPATTAAEGMDYEFPMGQMINIAAGTNRSCIRVSIVRSIVVEEQEQIVLGMNTTVNADIVGPQTTITILPDSVVVVGFRESGYTVLEGETVDMAVLKSAVFELAISFEVSVGGVSLGVFEFPAGGPVNDSDIMIPYTAPDNNIALQDNIMLQANLTVITSSPQIRTLNTMIPITIMDDEGDVTVGFDNPGIVVRESDGNITVSVSIDQDIENPLSVLVAFRIITAFPGSDYVERPVQLGFTSIGTMTVVVQIVDDNFIEPTESFNLTLLNPSSMGTVIIGAGTFTVTILDDDIPRVRFDRAPALYFTSEMESNVSVCIIVTNGRLPNSLMVNVDVLSSSTAELGEDFNFIVGPQLTIPERDFMGCLSISIIQSPLVEGEEQIILAINDNTTQAIIETGLGETTIVIARDGVVAVGFNQADYSFLEGQPAIVTIEKSGPLDIDIILEFGDGVSTATYMFLAGDATPNSIFVTLNVSDNNIALEPPHVIQLSLSIVSPVGGQAVLGQGMATATITDDEGAVSMQLDDTDISVLEDVGNVLVPVSISSPVAVTVQASFSYDFMDTDANDLVITGQSEVVFRPGSPTTQDILIAILDDFILEPDESFSVILRNPVPANGDVVITSNITTITIINNDVAVRVGFEMTSLTISEEVGTIQIPVTISQPVQTPITLSISSMGGSATEGTDYTIRGQSTLTFNSSGTRNILVEIRDDDIFEPAESFSIILSNVMSAATVVIDPDNITIVINDNDPRPLTEFEYLTLGEDAVQLRMEDESSSGPINVTGRIPMFDQYFSSLDIVENGAIFFGSLKENVAPSLFANLRDVPPFVAPYWIESDLSLGGSVAYAVFTEGDERISAVNKFLERSESVEFNGTWMLVVSWTEVPLFGSGEEDTVNSYQAIIVTDTSSTYSIFTYRCNELDNSTLGGRVGYYVDSSDFFEEELSVADMPFLVACQNDPVSPWSNVVYNLSSVRVGFKMTALIVDEGAGNIEVPVIINQPLSTPVTVSISFMAGSATEGVDYIITGQSTLTFNTSGTRNILVGIRDDDIFEPAESFSIILSNVMSDVSAVIDPDTIIVVIENNDLPTPVLSLRCATTSLPGREIFNCEASNDIARVTCSFDGVDPENCSFPVAADSHQFQTDAHTLVVVVVDVFGQSASFTFNFAIRSFEYLTLGGSAIQLRTEDESSSGPINATVRIPISCQYFSSLDIVENGAIFFGTHKENVAPSLFANLRDVPPFVAPYWIESDLSLGGSVAYAVFTEGDERISAVNQFLERSESVEFNGTWMLVVSWTEVPLFGSGEDDTVNSYQAIVVTDSNLTYSIFTYRCDELDNSTLGGRVGYYVDSSDFFEEELSVADMPFLVACQNDPVSPWSNVVYNLHADGVLALLELGVTEGIVRNYLPEQDDVFSMNIQSLPGGVPMRAGINATIFNIHTNGLISINGRTGLQLPRPFSSLVEAGSFIAPYWIDNNPPRGGNVSYEVHGRDSPMLNTVNCAISQHESITFNGVWMLVAYWLDIPLAETRMTSTYQGIVITDRQDSYAVFLYQCEGLATDMAARIGYYLSSEAFVEHPRSGNRPSDIGCEQPVVFYKLT